ncbi:AAA family ATPase [Candidatus Woesearchaeota archaeon]|nr:AAA family ATPase [Candidatus Woesearchaeota archaeon]
MEVEEQIKVLREFIEQNYYPQLLEGVRKGQMFLALDFSELVKFNTEISEELLESPEEVLKAAEMAVKEFDLPQKVQKFTIRLVNLPDSQKINVSDIRSKHLNKFLWTEGVVRQKSDVRPHVAAAKFECPSCGNVITIIQLDKKYKEPSKCSCGRKGKFKEIARELVDGQGIVLEENADELDGVQPKRINVFLKDDLVAPISERRTGPGSRVRICGWVTEVPIILKTGGQSTKYDLIIEANNIEPLQEDAIETNISEQEEEEIKKLARNPNALNILASSITPSIYGHDKIKEALVLQLAGGCRKTRSDGVSTRGDIHILLVGDPGSGKSQILKRITGVAPKARFTSGKGSTAAGLTASVVKDEFLGGWSLEAGTLVLANRGFAIIDEMDKMNKDDRSALHEALEQQSYHPQTEIMLSDGSVHKIGELVDSLMERNAEKVITGKNCEILDCELELLTTNFTKIFPVKACRVSRHIAPSKFVEIEFQNGRKIMVTPEHPLFVYNSELKEVPAYKIKKGELCPGPRVLPTIEREISLEKIPISKYQKEVCFPEEIDAPLGRLMGYLVTEGHSYHQPSNHYAEIGISNTNFTITNDAKNLMENLFKTNINQNIAPFYRRKKATKDLITVRCCSEPLYRFFKTNFKELLKKATSKRIPNLIRFSGSAVKISLLQSAFKGDGFIDSERFGYSTSSYELAKDYQDLLLGTGIYSYIASSKQSGNMTAPAYKVVVSGAESMGRFMEKIVEKDDSRLERLNRLAKRSTQKTNDWDIFPLTTGTRLKNILTELRLDDGYFYNTIKNGNNVHRKTIQYYIEKINAKLTECEKVVSESDNPRKIRRVCNLQLKELSQELKVCAGTIYNLEKKRNERLITIVKKKAEARINKLKNEVEKLNNLIHSDLRFLKIKSVKEIENNGVKWVYDVAVEPNQNFVSEGLILHNSVSISKANIQATLRCETTVLAAANPKLGRFDPEDLIARQIDLPPTLINRFDLIFAIKDLPNKEKDEQTATFILNLHKDSEIKAEVPTILLKKYFAYIRQKINPKITDAAIEELKDYYINMRNTGTTEESGVRTIPITARQLEALVRLSEAAAKIRLAKTVTKKDAQKAIEMIDYCLNEIAKDKETGTIDIDRLGSRMTASQRGSISVIKEIMTILEEQTKSKIIPVEDIINAAKEKNMGEDQVNEILEKLRRSGDIFEPRKNFVQKL